uniref:Protein kinase domain-containing protein n=1 Tax=Kryptolebias marmoratus TaxID=37003 RepID=A0A3Q3BNH6_KRYMA
HFQTGSRGVRREPEATKSRSPSDDSGSSEFSSQKLSRSKRTIAAKHVNKKLLRREQVLQEIRLLQTLDHPNLVKLLDTYETANSYVLVLEMADQGRFLDYIVSWGNLTEEKVALYLRDILEALRYLHRWQIAHLDVKPENIVVEHVSSQPVIKLTDFGDAAQLNPHSSYIHPLLGSPEFCAPELVLGQPASLMSDLWSLGVVTYVLLSGASPFLDESLEETCLNICHLDFSFPEDYFQGVSPAARDFVCLLLRGEPERRRGSRQQGPPVLQGQKETNHHKQVFRRDIKVTFCAIVCFSSSALLSSNG